MEMSVIIYQTEQFIPKILKIYLTSLFEKGEVCGTDPSLQIK
jgi:hypothetical protein